MSRIYSVFNVLLLVGAANALTCPKGQVVTTAKYLFPDKSNRSAPYDVCVSCADLGCPAGTCSNKVGCTKCAGGSVPYAKTTVVGGGSMSVYEVQGWQMKACLSCSDAKCAPGACKASAGCTKCPAGHVKYQGCSSPAAYYGGNYGPGPKPFDPHFIGYMMVGALNSDGIPFGWTNAASCTPVKDLQCPSAAKDLTGCTTCAKGLTLAHPAGKVLPPNFNTCQPCSRFNCKDCSPAKGCTSCKAGAILTAPVKSAGQGTAYRGAAAGAICTPCATLGCSQCTKGKGCTACPKGKYLYLYGPWSSPSGDTLTSCNSCAKDLLCDECDAVKGCKSCGKDLFRVDYVGSQSRCYPCVGCSTVGGACVAGKGCTRCAKGLALLSYYSPDGSYVDSANMCAKPL